MKQVNIDGAFLMLHGPLVRVVSKACLNSQTFHLLDQKLTSSAICMDKAFTHQICEKEGIKMAKYQLITSIDDIDFINQEYPCCQTKS